MFVKYLDHNILRNRVDAALEALHAHTKYYQEKIANKKLPQGKIEDGWLISLEYFKDAQKIIKNIDRILYLCDDALDVRFILTQEEYDVLSEWAHPDKMEEFNYCKTMEVI